MPHLKSSQFKGLPSKGTRRAQPVPFTVTNVLIREKTQGRGRDGKIKKMEITEQDEAKPNPGPCITHTHTPC